jgi:hypothetical protein
LKSNCTHHLRKIFTEAREAIGLPTYPPDIAAQNEQACAKWLIRQINFWYSVLEDIPEEQWDAALHRALRDHTSTYAIVPGEIRSAALTIAAEQRSAARAVANDCVYCRFLEENPDGPYKICPRHEALKALK